jgi:Mitochondrial carrier protein
MQSMKKNPNKPAKLSVWGTAKFIYNEAGFKGLYRGVTPRIALGVWQTICMVALGDVAKVNLSISLLIATGIYCKLDGRKAYWTLIQLDIHVLFRFLLFAFWGKSLIKFSAYILSVYCE